MSVGRRLLSRLPAGQMVTAASAAVTRRALAALSQRESDPYHSWVARFDTIDQSARFRLKSYLSYTGAIPRTLFRSKGELAANPLLSVIMPTYNSNETYLKRAIESVIGQVYGNWELCISDDASSGPNIRTILESYANRDTRIKLSFSSENRHISAASNVALAMAEGEFVVLMDHDDELAPHAMASVALEILRHPDAALIYSDEDKIDDRGERDGPYFKSDFDPELILAQNYMNHLSAFRRELVEKVGGFRMGFEGSQDWDLVLRVLEQIAPSQIRHIPHVLYHWRIHPDSAAGAPDAKPYALISAEKAVNEHLYRTGVRASISPGPTAFGMQIKYSLPEQLPPVSIVMESSSMALSEIRSSVASLKDQTSYGPLEILLVDNRMSTRPSKNDRFDGLGFEGVRIVRAASGLSSSAVRNIGANEASGELLCFLNADLHPIEPEWLSAMVRHASRPEIAVVGAKLLYPNSTVHHGGIVLGFPRRDGIGYASEFLPWDNPGYFGKAVSALSLLAVTGDCLMVRKDLFSSVGGMDAEHFPHFYADVDLCLRLREAGFRNIFEPSALLKWTHQPQGPRETAGAEPSEVAWMRSRWDTVMTRDPFHNPNLSLDSTGYELAWPPRVSGPWNPSYFPRPGQLLDDMVRKSAT